LHTPVLTYAQTQTHLEQDRGVHGAFVRQFLKKETVTVQIWK